MKKILSYSKCVVQKVSLDLNNSDTKYSIVCYWDLVLNRMWMNNFKNNIWSLLRAGMMMKCYNQLYAKWSTACLSHPRIRAYTCTLYVAKHTNYNPSHKIKQLLHWYCVKQHTWMNDAWWVLMQAATGCYYLLYTLYTSIMFMQDKVVLPFNV